ncbi:MAG: transcriptional regulator [Ponticaulis sp.]|nr:transcriptional regulator [Ponticaulis sp.]|tara:strand:+ start:12717 stop:13148 length:432 start_codon:yes stop_codon:yes gene_type:complete
MISENTNSSLEADEIMRMTTDIVASFVANNPVPSDSLPDLIASVHKTVTNLSSKEAAQTQERPKPAVPISRSITDDHIICLEDGKKLKMLKRYLRSHYGMTPEEYRKRWGLPADYPMVAPSYTKKRSDFAKQIGLGKVSGRRS